jgi:hypothetical protein
MASMAAALGGCAEERFPPLPGHPPDLPPFSAENLHKLLDALLAAYEAHYPGIGETLLPPIGAGELHSRCDWFPGRLPAEIIALYGWRGGQDLSHLGAEEPAFWSPDNIFCSPEDAAAAYRSISWSYALWPPDRNLLRYAFPFATFEGSSYVLPTRSQGLPPGLERPVISVFEGVDIYFHSLESLVRTCLDWITHPGYRGDAALGSEIEMDIWLRHNPGLFTY